MIIDRRRANVQEGTDCTIGVATDVQSFAAGEQGVHASSLLINARAAPFGVGKRLEMLFTPV
jgi:hypothetical protein